MGTSPWYIEVLIRCSARMKLAAILVAIYEVELETWGTKGLVLLSGKDVDYKIGVMMVEVFADVSGVIVG